MFYQFGSIKVKTQVQSQKPKARITSLSSGLRYAQPLNSSVMQNREVQNQKPKPDLVGSWIRENSGSLVVLFGGDFNGWIFVAGRMGGNFNFSVSNGGRFFWFQNPRLGWLQNSSWHCANRAVMLCGFGGK